MPRTRSFVVVRPEKLGDLIVATPVLRALKESFPAARVDVLTDMDHAAVLEHHPFVDQVIPIRWKWRARGQHEDILSIAAILRGRHYTDALILYANWSGWNAVCALAGIWRVTQIGGTVLGVMLGHHIVRRRAADRDLHYRDYYLEVAEAAGAQSPRNRDPLVLVTQDEIGALNDRYPPSSSRRRVVVHPFGYGSAPNFSPDAYRRLALDIAKLDVDVFISGSRKDAENFSVPDHPLIHKEWLGRLSLREMMAALKTVDVMVAGSTGVIHLAAALGTPTVGVYCPSLGCHPHSWGPLGGLTSPITVPANLCRRIQQCDSACKGGPSCDLSFGISNSDIVTAVRSYLR